MGQRQRFLSPAGHSAPLPTRAWARPSAGAQGLILPGLWGAPLLPVSAGDTVGERARSSPLVSAGPRQDPAGAPLHTSTVSGGLGRTWEVGVARMCMRVSAPGSRRVLRQACGSSLPGTPPPQRHPSPLGSLPRPPRLKTAHAPLVLPPSLPQSKER